MADLKALFGQMQRNEPRLAGRVQCWRFVPLVANVLCIPFFYAGFYATFFGAASDDMATMTAGLMCLVLMVCCLFVLGLSIFMNIHARNAWSAALRLTVGPEIPRLQAHFGGQVHISIESHSSGAVLVCMCCCYPFAACIWAVAAPPPCALRLELTAGVVPQTMQRGSGASPPVVIAQQMELVPMGLPGAQMPPPVVVGQVVATPVAGPSAMYSSGPSSSSDGPLKGKV